MPEIFGKIESLLDNKSVNNEITHNEDFYKEHSVLPLDYQHAQLLGVEYEKVNPDTSIEVCAKMEDIIATAWKWHSSHPNGYNDR